MTYSWTRFRLTIIDEKIGGKRNGRFRAFRCHNRPFAHLACQGSYAPYLGRSQRLLHIPKAVVFGPGSHS